MNAGKILAALIDRLCHSLLVSGNLGARLSTHTQDAWNKNKSPIRGLFLSQSSLLIRLFITKACFIQPINRYLTHEYSSFRMWELFN